MKKGFSLLEIIATTLILGFIILGAFELFNQGYRWMAKEKQYSIALALAQERIEEYSYGPLVFATGTSVQNEAVVAGYPGFSRQTALTVPSPLVPLGPRQYCAGVTVTVSWRGIMGKMKSLILRTLVANF